MLSPGRKQVASPEELRRRSIRLVTAALIAAALAAVGVATVIAMVVGKRIAREDALQEAIRTAQATADLVFARDIPDVLAHRPGAIARLDAEVAQRRHHGLVFRVKVWTGGGEVIYCDNHRAIGKRYPLDHAVRDAILKDTSSADISNLTAAENATEAGKATHLIEVYTPLHAAGGRRLAFEAYTNDSRVRAAEHGLISRLVPAALLSACALILLQLPVSVWLVRRVARDSAERATLLGRLITASETERRHIAHDLHDTVVQDLAGAGYALNSLTSHPDPGIDDDAIGLLTRVSNAVQDAVRSLRTLIVDIYPPDLRAGEMAPAIDDVARPLRESGMSVTVTADPSLRSVNVPADQTAMLYRCARECLTNIRKHAHARNAWVTVATSGPSVVLTVSDNGIGLPPTGTDRRAEGHLGLAMLRDAVQNMGGQLEVTTRSEGGTQVTVRLPLRRESDERSRNGSRP